jgi:hypothetical protein
LSVYFLSSNLLVHDSRLDFKNYHPQADAHCKSQ